MIGRDNPKVNKSIEKLFDEELKKSWWRIAQMDPCHIYAAYNALKSEYIENKQGSKLLLIDPKLAEKQLNDKQMRIGEETRKSLALLSKNEKETFYSRYRFISDLLSLNEVNRLSDEWLMYSIEAIDDSWIIKRKHIDVEYHEINFYWNNVLSIFRSSEHPKYPTLSKLIKNILIISHGDADVERGFSINQNILTEDRTLLSEKSINGLRTTYDVVEFLGFEPVHKMPTNVDMFHAVQKSTALYKEEVLKMRIFIIAQQKRSEHREQNVKLKIKAI
ncbi:unnamed protein product [Adineta steineri]|uniref:HAT C-terminal dimerisation domain-containing protein n=1 Tax=Adineta steineri TaxID=433720 RepID=A0A813W3U9_9BILA|nr:unnamed protein product [Adineta steineri]